MDEKPTTPRPEEPEGPAAAEWLFRDDPAVRKKPVEPGAEPGGETFELDESSAPASARRPPPPDWGPDDAARDDESLPPRERGPRPERPTPRRRDAGQAVDHPWTRWDEWASMIAALVLWTAVAMGFVYIMVASGQTGAAVVAFVIGTVVGLALFYPIVITLERPTRMTPEQALRDYYQALSHHFPHHRRMWLLLSNVGRTSSKFASYEGFKRYWQSRLRKLREGKAGGMTPLTFVVSDFKSERSGGKVEIAATWTVLVFVRGRREEGPIRIFHVAGTFAKGPDNMWYLDDGALEDRPAKKTARTAE